MTEQDRGPRAVPSPEKEQAELIESVLHTFHEMQEILASGRDALLDLNVTMPQLKALVIIARRQGVEGISGGGLTKALGVSLATTTGIVDRLVGQGLVTRREDTHDRRVRRIQLSPQGLELMHRLRTDGERRQRALYGRLDVETLRSLDSVMKKLVIAAAEEAAAESGVQSE